MHFEITASQQAIRQNLTPAQRNSSLFSEAPRIGGRTLRRGQMLKFDESQFKANEVIIKRLFDAGAIEIVHVVGDKRANLRTQKFGVEAVEAAATVETKKIEAVDDQKPPDDSAALSATAPSAEVPTEAKPLAEETVTQPAPVVEVAPAVEPVPAVEAAPVVEVPPAVEVPVEAAPVVEQSKGKKGKK